MPRGILAMCCALWAGCIPGSADDDAPEPGTDPTAHVCGDGVLTDFYESCDDGNAESGDGCSNRCFIETTVTMSWKLTNLAGMPQPCPAGFDAIELLVAPDPRLATIETFPCQDGQETRVLESNPRLPSYYVQLKMMQNSTHEGSAIKYTNIRPAGSPISVPFTMITDAGRATVNWNLKTAMGDTASCELLGVSNVQLEAIPASGLPLTWTMPCLGFFPGSYHADTGLLPAGQYRIVLTASTATESRSVAVDGVEVPLAERAVSVGPLDVVF